MNLNEANTYDDNWRPSARDMHLINTGRKPAWAKKVTEIGPREKRLRTANTPSELAMRKVTEPDYRPPFSETDLKTVRKGELMMNQRIADAIARKVDLNVSASADGISVDSSKSPVRFFIWSHGLDYVVKIIRSATEHDVIRCKSIKEIVDVINKNTIGENTIGENMNLNEAKRILKNAGYLIERDTQDIPEKYSDDVYNNIYAEFYKFYNKEEFLRFYNENKEKIDDYTKLGWKLHFTAEFVARSILDDLY